MSAPVDFDLGSVLGVRLLGAGGHEVAAVARLLGPRRRNELIECAGERERQLLHAALAGKRAYEVRHPQPVSLSVLYRVLAEVCR